MKAILVIDMPNTCADCRLVNEDYDICQATLKSISYNERGYGFECPLKPMPKQIIKTESDKTYWDCPEFYNGYNTCIDEILGEQK